MIDQTKPRDVWAAILLSFLSFSSLLYVGKPRLFALMQGCTFAILLGVIFGFPGLATPAGILAVAGATLGMLVVSLTISVRAAWSGADHTMRWYNRWWVYAGVWVLSLGLGSFGPIYLVERQAVKTYALPSTSMAPTFMAGTYVVADQSSGAVANVQRGDVIAFEPSARGVFAARVVAGPGDRIGLQDGRPVVNGEVAIYSPAGEITIRGFDGRSVDLPLEQVTSADISHLITRRENHAIRRNAPDVTLGPDEFYVMGDDRENAQDSFNVYGAVQRDQILGIITGAYWPL